MNLHQVVVEKEGGRRGELDNLSKLSPLSLFFSPLFPFLWPESRRREGGRGNGACENSAPADVVSTTFRLDTEHVLLSPEQKLVVKKARSD